MLQKLKAVLALREPGESWPDFISRVRMIVEMRNLSAKKRIGKEELEQLKKVIDSGNLFNGPFVQKFTKKFARMFGVKYAVPSTSGTAAVHVAVAMLNPDPGDEFIVPPITDMGTIIPILYQNCIPVFADVHPELWTIDPEKVEKAITPRTRGIIAVHLFGSPCDMEPLLRIGKKHGIPVIEDCAQAHFTEYQCKKVGTIGDIGCFSFQHSKHITTGEGGITVTNNSEYGKRGLLFVDKGWNRGASGARQYPMLGMNYRLTELQGAVGIAQLDKLKGITDSRHRNGTLLSQLLSEIDGIIPQRVDPGNKHTYWVHAFAVDPDAPYSVDSLVNLLKKERISAGAHYIGLPIFRCSQILQSKCLYGTSQFPFDGTTGRCDVNYMAGECPVAEDLLRRIFSIKVSTNYTEKHVKEIAKMVKKVADQLSKNAHITVGDIKEDVKYRCAIIGCGVISRRHAEAYAAYPGARVMAIADPNPDALKTIGVEYGVPGRYADYKEMLKKEKLDVVSICTWPGLHAEMTIAAAQSGVKAILCEKPIAVNLSQAEEMIKVCEENNVKLVIGHQMRFNPHFNEARRIIKSGELGDVLFIWGHIRDTLLNNGTHMVDTMRFLLGDPPAEWILGQIQRKKDSYDRGHRVEEIAEGLVQFANGTRGFIETGDLAVQELGFHVYGSEGQLDVNSKQLRLHLKSEKGWKNVQLNTENYSLRQVNELFDWLEGKTDDHRNNAHQARQTLEILMAIFESVRTHGVVRPPVAINGSPLDVMVEQGVL